MSSKLEQALMRLDTVVQALEKAPPPSAASPGDSKIKEEIHAIRSLVDEAMTLLAQNDAPSTNGEAS